MKVLQVSVLLAVLGKYNTNTCVGESSVVEDGVRLEGHVFRMENDVSMYMCIARCQMSETCQSVNYDLWTDSCEMNKIGADVTVNKQFVDGYVHVTMTKWSHSLSGPCSEMPCLPNQKCTVDRKMQTQCVNEFPGCDIPSALQNASVQYSGLTLQSTAVYTCVHGYHLCGEGHIAYCSENGTWTELGVTCEKDVPNLTEFTDFVKKTLPCPMTEGRSVSIYGTPEKLTGHRKISINLMTEVDIVIHFDIRFFIPEVLWNSYMGGQWGTPYSLQSFPFDYGQPFHINITRKGNKYQAAVDGVDHSSYPDSYPNVDAVAIAVDFDIKDERVTMTGCPWC